MFNIINPSDPHTLLYIKTIGYPAMFLIMILEGPIITLIGAFLASLGIFNVFIVLSLSILGDIVGDIILYAIGYYGGANILPKAERFLKIQPATIGKLKNYFIKHGRKTIFYVKSTTGLCWITFITAGTIKMNFRDFAMASFWGGIVWSSFLVISGYFFGYAFEKINNYIKSAGLIVFISVVMFYFIILLYKKYQAKKILENGSNKPTNA